MTTTLTTAFETCGDVERALDRPSPENGIDSAPISVEIDDALVDKVQRCFVTYGERAS